MLTVLFERKFAILVYMKPLSLARPHLIVMVGISGAGKSQFATQFADVFKVPLISREQALTQIFPGVNFDQSKSETADRANRYLLDQLLKTEQTIVYDGASDTRAERLELTKIAKAAGYEALFVWVQTDPLEAKRRAIKLNKARSLSSNQYEASLARFRVPTAAEKAVVISGKHTFASQLKIVLKNLSGDRAEAASRTIIPPRPSRNIIIR